MPKAHTKAEATPQTRKNAPRSARREGRTNARPDRADAPEQAQRAAHAPQVTPQGASRYCQRSRPYAHRAKCG